MSATSRDALRAALLYPRVSIGWLQSSGHLLSSFFDSSEALQRGQLINGQAAASLAAFLKMPFASKPAPTGGL